MSKIVIRTVSTDDANESCKICSEDLGYSCNSSLIIEKIKNINVNREAVYVALVDEIVV